MTTASRSPDLSTVLGAAWSVIVSSSTVTPAAAAAASICAAGQRRRAHADVLRRSRSVDGVQDESARDHGQNEEQRGQPESLGRHAGADLTARHQPDRTDAAHELLEGGLVGGHDACSSRRLAADHVSVEVGERGSLSAELVDRSGPRAAASRTWPTSSRSSATSTTCARLRPRRPAPGGRPTATVRRAGRPPPSAVRRCAGAPRCHRRRPWRRPDDPDPVAEPSTSSS